MTPILFWQLTVIIGMIALVGTFIGITLYEWLWGNGKNRRDYERDRKKYGGP